jgi:hypothetical protein
MMRGTGALAVVTAALVAVALLLLPRTTRFSARGIEFQIPSSWSVHQDIPPTFGFGQVFALLGTMPWGPCEDADINCHYQERFGRHEIEVEVGVMHGLGTDFCTYARERPDIEGMTGGVRVAETHYIRIDGRPAIATSYSLDSSDYYGSDGWRKWEIAPADSIQARYQIFARWRGPGDEAFLAALDQMIATVELGPSGYASPTLEDCGDPFPAPA